MTNAEAVTPAAGQFWALETNGHRAEVLRTDEDMVRVYLWEDGNEFAWVSIDWLTNHATLLHGSMAEAQLEAMLEDRDRGDKRMPEGSWPIRRLSL